VRLQTLLLTGFMALHGEEPTACAVRSIVTAPAGITEQGVLVLEFGGSQAYARDESRQGGLKAQVDLGLAPWADLRCGWTALAWNREAGGELQRGISDPYLGGQLLLAGQAKAGGDIGLIYSHLLPLANAQRGLSSGFHEDTLLLAFSRSMGAWALDANAGFLRSRVEDGSRKAQQRVGSLAITYAPACGWSLSLDTYGAAGSALGGAELGSLLAASRELTPSLKVDLSLGHGWAETSPRLVFNAGLMYRVARLW